MKLQHVMSDYLGYTLNIAIPKYIKEQPFVYMCLCVCAGNSGHEGACLPDTLCHLNIFHFWSPKAL